MATALQTNTTLSSLNLVDNDIGAAATMALLSARQSSTFRLDPNFFDGAQDCCSQFVQAGASWDLSSKQLSSRDMDWLAIALGDPRVRLQTASSCVLHANASHLALTLNGVFVRCTCCVVCLMSIDCTDQHDAHIADAGRKLHWRCGFDGIGNIASDQHDAYFAEPVQQLCRWWRCDNSDYQPNAYLAEPIR